MTMKKLPLLSSDRDVARCVNQLKVLADSTRLAVVRLLLQQSQYVHTLSERLSVEQSLLSHHLKILRDAKLVAGTRDGKQVRYSVTEGIRHSFESKDAIDLGCCRLTFDEPAPPRRKATAKARPRTRTRNV